MKRMLLLLGLSCLMACSVTSTSVTAPAPTGGTADAYIRAAAQRFATAFNSGDMDGVVSFYTDDAALLPPNADISRGHSGIRSAFSTFIPMKPQLALTTDRIVESCDVAYEYGTFTMKFTPPGAAEMSDRGKFVTIWRKQPNGDWKIAVDMFNTSLPAPGM
ncbi:MAG TPA: DUF4440 domain-containing protein [Thermoanaerobaculia bacterium]